MESIFVTKPYLPALDSYTCHLNELWKSRVLSNCGWYHTQLNNALCKELGLSKISLVNNGTLALELAIQALGLKGLIITSPYSFVATANSILLKGLKPVFIDIEDNGFNMDPELIDEAYSRKVSAVMPVHVYGIPCNKNRLRQITSSKGIKLIYDAAHAFGVSIEGESILRWGDVSTLSFHATKVFHTFEGGAIVTEDQELIDRIEKLRNFGFDNSGDVVALGTNAKMNEAQAAMGLLLTEHIHKIKSLRMKWHQLYLELLKSIPGIKLLQIPHDLDYNYSYFPILVESEFSLSRDQLFTKFVEANIFPRKYFFPLITDYTLYKGYKIISKKKTPNARRVADSVICLPLYPDLTESDVNRIYDVLKKTQSSKS